MEGREQQEELEGNAAQRGGGEDEAHLVAGGKVDPDLPGGLVIAFRAAEGGRALQDLLGRRLSILGAAHGGVGPADE